MENIVDGKMWFIDLLTEFGGKEGLKSSPIKLWAAYCIVLKRIKMLKPIAY